jgi:hypothetical protein
MSNVLSDGIMGLGAAVVAVGAYQIWESSLGAKPVAASVAKKYDDL